ncbi:hydroxyethylthiazole kinase [Candidatus Hydrogenosomobacter endosymbioticus]|uniref:Hydroxyethylthiazole kinase n=1 Tax=Candidatus Hydrogenosomobacter endosymbioticus TaxID=2558174 RepID=A0ABM7V9A8_9PROT|nr:hydroxyethylthiazole kinase [Candidatus Hydrogenosomobacter endosymbioticus]BDB96368.1 hydroxyethylthiazole kinase [Candidatus Hydrogenosomobacter endosymbioticus]
MKKIELEVCEIIQEVRKKKPVVLCATNFVTMEFVANVLLAVGASPIVSICAEEAEELVRISSAVYINIGTLDLQFLEFCRYVSRFALRYEIPVVVDPVGCGASNLRTSVSVEIAKCATIIRGNASEIMSLSRAFDGCFESKNIGGVDSLSSSEQAKSSAIAIVRNLGCVVAASGEKDLIVSSENSCELFGGCELMQNITGMGCSLTGLAAAFSSVSDPFTASRLASACFCMCADKAFETVKAPGSFRQSFIDEVYSLGASNLRASEE